MSVLEDLIKKHCPNGVEYVPLWSVTIWDKKFNSVDRKKQPEVINYPYLLASDLFAMEQDNGDVFLLSMVMFSLSSLEIRVLFQKRHLLYGKRFRTNKKRLVDFIVALIMWLLIIFL